MLTLTTNTHGTDRILEQTTSGGQNWKFAYKRVGACVVSRPSVPEAFRLTANPSFH